MTTYFYSHLVNLDIIAQDLEALSLSKKEKQQLLKIAHDHLHHQILDAILSELTEEDKRTFLLYLHRSQHDKIWEHLNSKVDKIEEKIQKVAEDLKKDLREDIKKTK